MSLSPLLSELIRNLQCLPGVGPKSAQRMAFALLQRSRSKGQELAQSLSTALAQIGNCERCRNLSELPICNLCQDVSRDRQQLCVVETPADIVAIEQTKVFKGKYFVLMGHLSPIDGIGPEQLGMDQLRELISTEGTRELILAISTTVEGEATAYYIAELSREFSQLSSTRLALGMPLGGELEQLDSSTLLRALSYRSKILET